MAKYLCNTMKEEDDILISRLCSDTDSSARDAFAEVLHEHRPDLELQWNKDPWHVGKRQKLSPPLVNLWCMLPGNTA